RCTARSGGYAMDFRHRIAIASVAVWGTAAFAAATPEQCTAALTPKGQEPGNNPCNRLVTIVYAGVQEALRNQNAVPPSAIQPQIQNGDRNASGPAVGVPSGFPTPLAGATVGVAGTKSGPRVLANLSVNPLSVGSDSTKALSWSSRLADITVLLPIATNTSTPPATTNGLDFVGVRLRVNGLAVSSGDAAYQTALDAYTNYANTSSALFESIRAALLGAADVSSCADALTSLNDVASVAACGGAISVSATRQADAVFRDKIKNALWEADRSYLGLDARLDVGDPTFSGNPAARGTVLVTTLAAGK